MEQASRTWPSMDQSHGTGYYLNFAVNGPVTWNRLLENFAVTGPVTWNRLLVEFRCLDFSVQILTKRLKVHLLSFVLDNSFATRLVTIHNIIISPTISLRRP